MNAEKSFGCALYIRCALSIKKYGTIRCVFCYWFLCWVKVWCYLTRRTVYGPHPHTFLGQLHEIPVITFQYYTFYVMVILTHFFLKWEMFQTSCRENKNKHFMLNTFFSENWAVYETMSKKWYSQTHHRWQHRTRALHGGYLRLQTHTHNM
jgi:hypothetical protein